MRVVVQVLSLSLSGGMKLEVGERDGEMKCRTPRLGVCSSPEHTISRFIG